MIPFGDQTVTLLHRQGDGYARHTLTGCSWRMANVHALEGTIMKRTVETTCRIPKGQFQIIAGDLLILGDVKANASNEIELVRLLESLRTSGVPAFRAIRVKNNAIDGLLPHYAVTGE